MDADKLINILKMRLTESQGLGGQLPDGPRKVAKLHWLELCDVAKEYYVLCECWPIGDNHTEFKIIEQQFKDILTLANMLSSRIKEVGKNSTMKMMVNKWYEYHTAEPSDKLYVTPDATPECLSPKWFWTLPEVLESIVEMMTLLGKSTEEIKLDEAKKGFKTLGAVRDHSLELVFMTGNVLVRKGEPKTYALPIAQVIHGWAMGEEKKASDGWGAAAYKDAKKLWGTRLVNIRPRKG